MKSVGIIDYLAGNAKSVQNAFKKLNIKAEFINSPEQILNASAIILPGVGSAGATMDSLKSMNIIKALDEALNIKNTPFLGICIGMQVLFENSEEDGADCLGFLKGKVKRFDKSLRIPQIGWNSVDFVIKDDPLIKDCQNPEYFYFVNSYYAVPENKDVILSVTDYGKDFCSAVRYKNIAATQFHLEKSGAAGLKILKNFADFAEVL